MHTDRRLRDFSFFCAVVLVAQIFSLGALPFELREPWDCVFHMLAYSGLVLLMWIATDGQRPRLAIGVAMALCLSDEVRQAFVPGRSAEVADFLAGALAAGATAFILAKNTKGPACAESSPRSPTAT